MKRVLSLLIVGLLLASCTASPPSTQSPTTVTSGTTPPPPSVIDQARALASRYDYDAAIALLSKENSDAASKALTEFQAAKAALVSWPDNGKVSHIFYHSLIVDPARAFSPKQVQRRGYAEYMVTLKEFKAQLEQIYAHGYVLIHPQRLAAKDASGVMTYTPIALPEGKKPLVLSIDDVSYYKYMDGAGFATNLTLVDGAVTNTYTDANGTTTHGAYDVSTVVDEFVARHPDFTYRGDKGTMALTGYEGVLGYRTSLTVFGDNDATRQAIATAKTVADALKAEGWSFASHSYGHIDMTKRSLVSIQQDILRWRKEVEPIIGQTDALIYAFGADIQKAQPYTTANAKYAFLLSQGFSYYFPIDATTPAWSQLTATSFRQARINIDGITMQRALDGKSKVLSNFFDTRSVLDPDRPIPTP